MIGQFFTEIQERYSNFESNDLTPFFGSNDPKYDHIPSYSATRKNFHNGYLVQLGVGVLSISSDGYNGWKEFYQESEFIFKSFFKLKLISKVNRIGLRYVNFFDFNIFDKLTITLKSKHQSIHEQNSELKTSCLYNSYSNNIRVSNNTKLTINQDELVGSIIDMDTVNTGSSEINDFLNEVNKMHNTEKKVFFSLLDDKYIETLNPKWEE
jgi:uncharacterized protein (TIGR04255 family)